jgi:Kef-type K+ transport system membrane component KefB
VIDIFYLFLGLGTLLFSARIFAEIAEHLGLPAIFGEIFAGIVLGQTLFGNVFPQVSRDMFPETGANAQVFKGLNEIAISLFLMVAGMEINLSSVWKQGKTVIRVSMASILVPFILGFFVAYQYPELFAKPEQSPKLIFALFLATAFSISALPVIAKILRDLNLYRTPLGIVIISAAVLSDLVGWNIFALIVGLVDTGLFNLSNFLYILFLSMGFALVVLSLGRKLINQMIPWLNAHFHGPGILLSIATSLALLGGAFTDWLGIHSIFGSFLVGIAFGESHHLREQVRKTLSHFISYIFAPIFFASIGLHINFIDHFNPLLILMVTGMAIFGKLAGVFIGGYSRGQNLRELFAIGVGLNARGVMEIILGLFAYQKGIINKEMLTALVIMAMLTSLMSGPLIRLLLKQKKKKHFTEFMNRSIFFPKLKGRERKQVLREMSGNLSRISKISEQKIFSALWKREELAATGIGQGVAVSHGRFPELSAFHIGAGLSLEGIDFDAPDGKPVHVVFVILSPEEKPLIQLDILADIARTFHGNLMGQNLLIYSRFVEFLSALKAEEEKNESSVHSDLN